MSRAHLTASRRGGAANRSYSLEVSSCNDSRGTPCWLSSRSWCQLAHTLRRPRHMMPRAGVRELATIEGDTSGFVCLPGCQTLIYGIKAESAGPNLPRADARHVRLRCRHETPHASRHEHASSGRVAAGQSVGLYAILGGPHGIFPVDDADRSEDRSATGQPQRVSLRPVSAIAPASRPMAG